MRQDVKILADYLLPVLDFSGDETLEEKKEVAMEISRSWGGFPLQFKHGGKVYITDECLNGNITVMEAKEGLVGRHTVLPTYHHD